jgi:hypothetical protein
MVGSLDEPHLSNFSHFAANIGWKMPGLFQEIEIVRMYANMTTHIQLTSVGLAPNNAHLMPHTY